MVSEEPEGQRWARSWSDPTSDPEPAAIGEPSAAPSRAAETTWPTISEVSSDGTDAVPPIRTHRTHVGREPRQPQQAASHPKRTRKRPTKTAADSQASERAGGGSCLAGVFLALGLVLFMFFVSQAWTERTYHLLGNVVGAIVTFLGTAAGAGVAVAESKGDRPGAVLLAVLSAVLLLGSIPLFILIDNPYLYR